MLRPPVLRSAKVHAPKLTSPTLRAGLLRAGLVRTGLIALIGFCAASVSEADPAKTLEKAPGAALEPGAAVERAFGNTILSTYADGRTARLWLQPDGTYRARGVKSEPSRGKWRISGAQLCLHPARLAALPVSYCTGLPPEGTSRSWVGKAFSGEPITIQLVEGQQGMPA
jgi:hypothetical protein